jgi:hypothetical protein
MTHDVDDPVTAPEKRGAQGIHDTTENAAALAAVFRECADNLISEVPHLKDDLLLDEPWLDDPVSRWARQRFDEYFVFGENSFTRVAEAEYAQHRAALDALDALATTVGTVGRAPARAANETASGAAARAAGGTAGEAAGKTASGTLDEPVDEPAVAPSNVVSIWRSRTGSGGPRP